MSKTSCVKHPPGNPFIILRLSYLQLCKGNATAAGLIHIFENWHNTKLDILDNWRGAPRTEKPTLWQAHSRSELEDALMGIGKRHSIDNAKDLLQEMGVITVSTNPDPAKLDNRTHYLFHPDVVSNLLALAENSNTPHAENSQTPGGNQPDPLAENSRTISKNNTEELTKSISPHRASAAQGDNVKKASKPAEPKSPPPKDPPPVPRPFFQAMVDTWFSWYKDHHRGEEPNFKGRNPAYFGKLYDLLQDRARKKEKAQPGKHEWTEAYGTESLRYFLEQSWAGDDWLKGHFLLSNLVDQFDTVYARIALAKPELPKGLAKAGSTRMDGIRYVVERHQDGDLDPRLLPEFYDTLLTNGMIQLGYLNQHAGDTPEEKKAAAALAWLNAQPRKTATTSNTPTTAVNVQRAAP